MRNVIAVLAVLALMLPQVASALECLIPSIQRDYWWHKERPETYVLALGGFTELRRAPKAGVSHAEVDLQAKIKVWTARFSGFTASRHAFDQPFETEAILVFPNYSFIAGGADTAAEVRTLPTQTGLVWLMKTERGYQATSGLCQGIVDTDPANVKPALRCLRGGHCPKSD